MSRFQLPPIASQAGDFAPVRHKTKRTQKEEMELRMYRAQQIVLETHLPSELQ